jgi:uncharacterized protein YjbJ (UPF0337 family)
MSGESAKDRIVGKAKEVAGKVSGDRRLEGEGHTDQAKGKVKGATEGAADKMRGVKDSLTDDDRT